ncbi:HNH endonuclease signature motif containing protein [Streptomyces arboris]|uniref:HNH endonuclease signature motif containing protein n=1 Tax=Streptomyces arboris TaxID=2600619 RepID=UPI003BF5F533
MAGCEVQQATKGYCRKHAHRVARHGDPHAARLRSIEIVAALPQPDGECISWPRLGATGYGRAVYKGKTYQAHRLVWEQQIGTIPAGLELDHLCCNRACVNTGHLEPVTGTENKRRRWARWWARQEAP